MLLKMALKLNYSEGCLLLFFLGHTTTHFTGFLATGCGHVTTFWPMTYEGIDVHLFQV